MTDLSPAAQAVYDAWYKSIDAYSEQDPPPQLAAALRAAASQLTNAKSADALRAIAAELEGADG